MATVIHHGGGVGTYKTFAVIQRHAIPQLQKGRTVVSTIRGFNSTRVIEAVLDIELPESAKIIYVDIDTIEGVRKIRKWWEWVPEGAYIIIDEAQKVYPKGHKIADYDYPARTQEIDGVEQPLSSAEAADFDNRPSGLVHAFTMQRHWNWDLALITPNIRMLIPELKEVTQVAYAHRKMGDLVPWRKHGWRETKHHPEESWKSSITPPIQYNADKRIYKVYQSTKTGDHKDGGAEQSIFKNPKVLTLLITIGISVPTFLYMLYGTIFNQGVNPVPVQGNANPQQIPASSRSNHVTPVPNATRSSTTHSVTQFQETTRLEFTQHISIIGQIGSDFIFEFGYPPDTYQLTTQDLTDSGVTVNHVNDCLAFLVTDTQKFRVRCPLHRRHFEAPKDQEQIPININPFQARGTDDA